MSFLLDTNALLWACLAPWLLSKAASVAVLNLDNKIYVSAASAWEIATKVRIGKLPGAEAFESDLLRYVLNAGYVMLPIRAETTLRAGRLAGMHRDPFDRMIAAQALELDVPLISSDKKMDEFMVRRVW